ncbi:class D sortase [Anaerotignum lactatifermentans]|uniref:class D sortase n=1 Tax=Anaerotignum lactatifermentans TaxID=160404 RepID=UPI001D685579|nr:class D sortase [Anaerotignum lactatifermentans]HJE93031.1 class D sortase [Anaerotignum lactatifermentans]
MGKSNINIQGEIPDYLRDIYDVSPQTVYDSEYGANVVEPNAPSINNTTYAPTNAPINPYTQSPNSLITGTAYGGGTSGSYIANISSDGYVTNEIPEQVYDEVLQYPLTTIEQVRNSDGSIGVLRIPEIGLTVTAYDGDTFTAMKKGVGHLASTSCWNGNIGLVGHNRGTNDYFGKLKKLDIGDEMTYTTKLGTRTYVVKSITKIADTDWSKLQYTSDNRLTLITCVEDVGDQRLCVQAVQK